MGLSPAATSRQGFPVFGRSNYPTSSFPAILSPSPVNWKDGISDLAPIVWDVTQVLAFYSLFPLFICSLMKQKFASRPATAATAAWPFGARSSFPAADPRGGDGGRGGDVIMVSSQRHNTLIHFRYNPEHKGQRGEHGMGSNCSGLDGHSVILQVPVGTSLYDQETGELIHDFRSPTSRSSSPRADAADAATSTLPPAPTRLRASTNWAAPARSAITAWS